MSDKNHKLVILTNLVVLSLTTNYSETTNARKSSRSIYNAIISTIATHLIITTILTVLLFSRVRQVLP